MISIVLPVVVVVPSVDETLVDVALVVEVVVGSATKEVIVILPI